MPASGSVPSPSATIESILEDGDLADAPLAARLARLSGGRPGLARSLALAPDAIAARDEIARTLLHLIGAGPSDRLASARGLLDRATELDRALERATLDAAAAGDGSGASGADPRRPERIPTIDAGRSGPIARGGRTDGAHRG